MLQLKIISFLLIIQATPLVSQSLDSTWAVLINKPGCLLGAQYDLREITIQAGDRPVINSTEWLRFQQTKKEVIVPFLISQLEDTSISNIHTCPCMQATKGEMAVYLLQRQTKTLWYNLPGFKKYGRKKDLGCFKGKQAWLQMILINKKKRKRLQAEFSKLIN